MKGMFLECYKLKEIKGINNFITIKATNMRRMFKDCNELEILDLSNFNTNKVTNMEKMFNKCYKLKEIKGIYNFFISNLTNLYKIFDECNDFEYINISKINPLYSEFISKILNRKKN